MYRIVINSHLTFCNLHWFTYLLKWSTGSKQTSYSLNILMGHSQLWHVASCLLFFVSTSTETCFMKFLKHSWYKNYLQWRHMGEWQYGSIHCYPQHEMVMSDQLHALAVLSLAKEPLVPNGEEPGWALEPLWVLWISHALDRSWTMISHMSSLKAIHYT